MKFTIDGKQIDGIAMAPDWIRNKLTPETIQYAEEFGKWLAGKGHDPLRRDQALTNTQFRNIYSEVVRIKMQPFEENEKDFLLLKARMAYTMARDNKPGGKALKAVLQAAMDEVMKVENDDKSIKQKRFDRFADFFEAILAYHSAFGGH